MAWYSSLIKIFSGSSGSIIDSISNSIDRFVTTDEEKKKLQMELQRILIEQQFNQFEFQKQMEELTQKREEEIEKSIRSEVESRANIILAEMKQDDKYTKRARPTVIYIGLFFIFLEIFGVRYLILDKLFDFNFNNILESSNTIFDTFLWAWGGVLSVYVAGRSAEKRGVKNKIISSITGWL